MKGFLTALSPISSLHSESLLVGHDLPDCAFLGGPPAVSVVCVLTSIP